MLRYHITAKLHRVYCVLPSVKCCRRLILNIDELDGKTDVRTQFCAVEGNTHYILWYVNCIKHLHWQYVYVIWNWSFGPASSTCGVSYWAWIHIQGSHLQWIFLVDSNRPITPESPLESSLYHATSTIDDLTTALANFSRVPSAEPPSTVACCRGKENWENLKSWLALKSRLASRLILSAGG